MTHSNYTPRVQRSGFTAIAAALLLALMTALPLTALADDGFPDSESHEPMTLEVNINQDDAEKIAELLDGVGPARAQAIVEYREANGGFESLSDLTNVSGVGPATLEANRDRLVLN